MKQLAVRFSRAATIIAGCYWLTIFIATHVPTTPEILHHSDKVLHFCAYAGLAFLLAVAWSLRRPIHFKHFVAIFMLMAFYGAFDEISQIPVGRTCDIMDWYADLAGAASGLSFLAGLMVLAAVTRSRKETKAEGAGG